MFDSAFWRTIRTKASSTSTSLLKDGRFTVSQLLYFLWRIPDCTKDATRLAAEAQCYVRVISVSDSDGTWPARCVLISNAGLSCRLRAYPLARQRPTSSGPCTNKTTHVPTYYNAEYSSTGRVSGSNLISSELIPKIRHAYQIAINQKLYIPRYGR